MLHARDTVSRKRQCQFLVRQILLLDGVTDHQRLQLYEFMWRNTPCVSSSRAEVGLAEGLCLFVAVRLHNNTLIFSG